MSYDGESFKEDCEWLRGQGVCTEELEDCIINIVKESFSMTRTEFIKFLRDIK